VSADRSLICVLGCGAMGAAIASVHASGMDVAVYDVDHERATAVADALGPRARAAGSIGEAVRGATMIFEAAPENLELKKEILGVASRSNEGAIIATNTSSLPVEALSEAVLNAERFLVAHFFNPADVVPLVEVVPSSGTDPEALRATVDHLRSVGKRPVVLRRAVPGFVANRLQAALLREALALERDGVAEFAAIDEVVRWGLGSRWAAAGPFQIVDLGGLDVWTAVTSHLFPLLSTQTSPPSALVDRLESGRLGAKSGEGIYGHDRAADARTMERMRGHFALEARATDDFPAPG